jgi:hypothetical protein
VFNTDELSIRHGNELGVAARGAKSWPTSVLTDLLITGAALTTGSVAPASRNYYLIADRKLSRLRHAITKRFHQIGYLVSRCYRVGLQGLLEVAINELYVRTTHSSASDPH